MQALGFAVVIARCSEEAAEQHIVATLRKAPATVFEAKVMKALRMSRKPRMRLTSPCNDYAEARPWVLLHDVGEPVRQFLLS